jgi:hypothetical protein
VFLFLHAYYSHPTISYVLSSDYSAKPCLKKDHRICPCSNAFFFDIPLSSFIYITHMLDYYILFFIYLFSTQTSFCRHAYSCCLFISDFFVSWMSVLSFFSKIRKKNSKENDRTIFSCLFFRLSLPM